MEVDFRSEIWWWPAARRLRAAGGYIVPIKAAVRRAEGVEVGDEVAVRLRVG